MTARRGLTLIEVLASTVLLAVVATTCMPVLSRAMRSMRQTDTTFALEELAALADVVAADPAGYGIADTGGGEIAWPEAPERAPIVVETLAAPSAREDESGPDHAWMRFRCEAWTVHRWIEVREVESDDTGEETPGDAPAPTRPEPEADR